MIKNGENCVKMTEKYAKLVEMTVERDCNSLWAESGKAGVSLARLKCKKIGFLDVERGQEWDFRGFP